jgi:hypothetical protein
MYLNSKNTVFQPNKKICRSNELQRQISLNKSKYEKKLITLLIHFDF